MSYFHILRHRLDEALPSASMLVAVFALCLASSTGGAYAAGQIGTSQIKDGAVTSAKIKNSNVRSLDLGSSAVTSAKIRSGNVKSLHLGSSAVTSAKIADRTIQLRDLGPDARPALPAALLSEHGNPPRPTDDFTTMLELPLPRGGWAVYAKGFMYLPSGFSLQCDLRIGTTVLDRVSGTDHSTGGGITVPFALMRPVALSGPATVALQCRRIGAGFQGVFDVKIMATQTR